MDLFHYPFSPEWILKGLGVITLAIIKGKDALHKKEAFY